MPIKIQKPRYALSSSLVIFTQELYLSSPITSLAYRLLCSTMASRSSGVKIRSKVSDGDSGMSTVGPTGELKGGMVSEVSVEDQQGRVSELEPGVSLGGGGGMESDRYHCHHHRLLYPPGAHPPSR